MKDPRTGVLAALGGCLAAGIATPLVGFLRVYRTDELLMVRGLTAAAAMLVILKFRVVWSGPKVLASALVLLVATWSYYQAMRIWGVDLTMAVLTTSPVVNFLLKRFVHRKRIALTAVAALVGIVAGAVLALQPWRGDLDARGLGWSLLSVVCTGIGFDLLGTSEGCPWSRIFWFSLVYAAGGATLCLAIGGHVPFAQAPLIGREAFLLAVFGVAGACVYVGNVFTFANLHRETASVLNSAQVVPAIVGAWLIMGEGLAWYRLLGVGLSFASATALSYVESRVST